MSEPLLHTSATAAAAAASTYITTIAKGVLTGLLPCYKSLQMFKIRPKPMAPPNIKCIYLGVIIVVFLCTVYIPFV